MGTLLENFGAIFIVGGSLLACGPHLRKVDTLKMLPLLSNGMTYADMVEKLGPPSM